MTRIFDLLDAIRSQIKKPHARITVEIFDMGIGDGLRFQFLWYEDKLIKLSVFISKTEIESVFDDGFLVKRVVTMVNAELDKLTEGESQ